MTVVNKKIVHIRPLFPGMTDFGCNHFRNDFLKKNKNQPKTKMADFQSATFLQENNYVRGNNFSMSSMYSRQVFSTTY